MNELKQKFIILESTLGAEITTLKDSVSSLNADLDLANARGAEITTFKDSVSSLKADLDLANTQITNSQFSSPKFFSGASKPVSSSSANNDLTAEMKFRD